MFLCILVFVSAYSKWAQRILCAEQEKLMDSNFFVFSYHLLMS